MLLDKKSTQHVISVAGGIKTPASRFRSSVEPSQPLKKNIAGLQTAKKITERLLYNNSTIAIHFELFYRLIN